MSAQLKMPRRCANTYGATDNCKELIGMDKRTCSVEGCESTYRMKREWCNKHYLRWHRHGDPLGPPKKPRKATPCSTLDCQDPAIIKGMCRPHYSRARRNGDPRTGVATCSVQDCEDPALGWGMCNMHYLRTGRHGDPAVRLTAATADDAFRMYVQHEGDCHVWTGVRNHKGYGRVSFDRTTMAAHRYAWERENGPIPEGLVVRHKCDNPPCVNPNHLEVGTQQDNVNDMIARGRAHWQKAG